MATHPKLLRQKPLDDWILHERLLLASAVLQSGDQNWVSVSRAIKNQSTESRPPEYFSQKNCALQYGDLLENAETPKRKRSEKNEVIPVETQGHQIANKLKLEYVEQLVQNIKKHQEEYQKLGDEIEMVSSGYCDEQLSEIWEQIQRKQNVKKEADAPISVSQSDTSIDNEQTFSSLATSAPDVDDTSTQDSQEADIEVDDNNEDVPSFSEAINSTMDSQNITSTTPEAVEKQVTPVAESTTLLSSADTDVEQCEVIETTEVVTTEVVEPVSDSTHVVEETVDTADTPDTQVEATVESVTESVTDTPAEPVPDESPIKSSVDESPAKSALGGSPTKSVTEDSNDSVADKVTEVSDLRLRIKSKYSSKSRQSSETSTQEDITVDDEVMPCPNKITSPLRVSNPITTEKTTSQLTISVVPAEIEQSMSPGISVSSASDDKSKEPTTPTNISASNRRRSSRVTKQKDDKKEDTSSVSTAKAASETEMASDDEEGTANTSKAIELTPTSPQTSQQGDVEDDKHHKQWKKTMLHIWKTISQHKFANVFMLQVTDDIAPGYSTCVLRPMCLTTIKQNIEKNIIKTTDEFVRDVMLMFINAMMYNNHEYDVYAMAQELYDVAIKTFERQAQFPIKETDLKLAGLRGRRSEASSSVDKDVEKGRRRSSADQHSDVSQPAAKKRKTRADD